jgi:uncharacterized membrane protein HdeD (DUF308 family)
MRSVTAIKIAKIGYLAISVLLCLFGLLFIVYPDFSVKTVSIYCGITLLVFGTIKIVGFLSKDLFRLAFENDLAHGGLMLALGISLLLHTRATIFFFCTVLGILILFDGLFKVQIAVEAKPFGIKKWWLILILAILTCVCGCALIFHPEESVRLITIFLGISLIFNGALNIITMLIAVKIMKVRNEKYIE